MLNIYIYTQTHVYIMCVPGVVSVTSPATTFALACSKLSRFHPSSCRSAAPLRASRSTDGFPMGPWASETNQRCGKNVVKTPAAKEKHAVASRNVT